MAFNLENVLSQANQVTNDSNGSSDSDRKYPQVIYPSSGTIKLKLLYNPQAGIVTRLIRRHKVNDTNHTCLKTYGQECPICKTVENINNSMNLDLWKFKDKARGLTYAQYVGSEGYEWTDGHPEPQIGELILFMYPWQIYQDINRIISSAGVNAVELIAKNEGKILNVIHSMVNGRHQYKAEVDAFSQPFKSCANDEEFEKYLNSIPNLNEAIAPVELTQDTLKDAQDTAETLSREYLRGVNNAMSGGFAGNTVSSNNNNQIVEVNGQQYVNVNGQLMPIMNSAPVPPTQTIPPVVNTAPAQNSFSQNMAPPQESVPNNNASNPECFGQHKQDDPKCMVCVYELQCMTASANN